MYKLVAFAALLAITSAAPAPDIIGAPIAAADPWGHGWGNPWGNPWGHGLVGAPVVKAALPVATSYANTVRVASPVVAHGPVLSPYAHGPVLSPYAHGSVLSPLAHGW